MGDALRSSRSEMQVAGKTAGGIGRNTIFLVQDCFITGHLRSLYAQ